MGGLVVGLVLFFLEWFGVINLERIGQVPEEYASKRNKWCSVTWLVFGIIGGIVWYFERFRGLVLSPIQDILLFFAFLVFLLLPRILITKYYQNKK